MKTQEVWQLLTNELAEDMIEWRRKFEFHIQGRGSYQGVHKYRALYHGVTTFSKVAPNISGSPAWNLLGVTLLAPSILRWLVNFSKIYKLLF
jgi:hypothetical protein